MTHGKEQDHPQEQTAAESMMKYLSDHNDEIIQRARRLLNPLEDHLALEEYADANSGEEILDSKKAGETVVFDHHAIAIARAEGGIALLGELLGKAHGSSELDTMKVFGRDDIRTELQDIAMEHPPVAHSLNVIQVAVKQMGSPESHYSDEQKQELFAAAVGLSQVITVSHGINKADYKVDDDRQQKMIRARETTQRRHVLNYGMHRLSANDQNHVASTLGRHKIVQRMTRALGPQT